MSRMRLHSIGLVATVTSLLLAVPAMAGKDKPAQEWDGLVRQSGTKLDNVWIRPNAQFKAYKRVRLPPVDVAFAEDWDPNHGTRTLSSRVTNADMQDIRAGLAQMFHDEFASRLGKRGYTLSEVNGEDVLIVQAALANLYIAAPQPGSASVTHTFTMNAGRVSVVMQLSDSVTQQLLARVVDTRQGQDTGYLTWTTSVSNSAEARHIIGIWADALCRALDKVNNKP